MECKGHLKGDTPSRVEGTPLQEWSGSIFSQVSKEMMLHQHNSKQVVKQIIGIIGFTLKIKRILSKSLILKGI